MSTRYLVGEGFVGSGADAAHVNVVVGDRDGPVGTAFATALASPSTGHTPFLVVSSPGLAVQPPTLFVNKAAVASDGHARLTWGAAQAGVADGTVDALADGSLDPGEVGRLVVVAAVWVDPAAADEDAVYENNRAATAEAHRNAASGGPAVTDLLSARGTAWNPFHRPPT